MNDAAGDPLRRAMWLDAVGRQLQAAWPANLRGHLRLGNVAEGRLSVLAASPIGANRARLASEEILEAARSVGLEARSLRVRVAIPAPAPVHVPEKPPSRAARAAVEEALALLRDR